MFLKTAYLILLILAGCQLTPKPPPNTLRISFAQDPATTDPRKSSDFASSTLICLLFEGLTRCTSGSEVELGLAEKIEISSDGKTYRFILKKTFWSDGRPVIAKDFECSWKTILTPGFPSPCAYLLYPIKNGELCAKGLCHLDEVGIHAIDDLTLVVELENATPYFLSLTAFPLYLPSPSHLDIETTCWSLSKEKPLICNGPFIIEKINPGEEIQLKKNNRFWNMPQVHLDQIQISIISNDITALQLFEKEELDIVGGPLTPISIDTLPHYTNRPELHFIPMAASTFCTLNTETFPFSNKALRKAFALAIQNNPLIRKEIEKLHQIQALHILPPSLSLLREKRIPNEDPLLYLGQALNELEIAREDLQSMTMYYKANPMEKKMAQTLQRTWEETLGIHIEIEQMDAKSLTQRLYAKNYQLSLASWIAQFHDPINILERFKEEKNPKNYSGWSSPKYKEVLSKAAISLNPQERIQYLTEAERSLEDQTVQIPLYHWSSPMLMQPRVHGLSFTSSGGILLERISIESESFSPHH